MNSRKYWMLRAVELENAVQLAAEIPIKRAYSAYTEAAKSIKADMRRILGNYGQLTELDPKKARELISAAEHDKTIAELRKLHKAAKTPEERRALENRINAKAYGYRMTRLEQMEQNIYIALKRAAAAECAADTEHFCAGIKKGYYSTLEDIAFSGNVGISFTEIPEKVIDRLVNDPWNGKRFSRRIWRNTDILASDMYSVLAKGTASGAGIYEMAQELDSIAKKGIFNAVRIIRTESNYFHNKGTLAEFTDADIDKYEFCAVLDAKTSEICRSLDGQIFETKKAAVGTNYPPMHPFCRSVAVQAMYKTVGKRAARNPETGKIEYVDSNISYTRWYENLSENQRKMLDGYGSDYAQYRRFMSVLGANKMPHGITEFQNLKYKNPDEFKRLEKLYKSTSASR